MDNQYKNLSDLPPVPTKFTIFMRTCVIWQIYRFLVLNLKMLRLIHREHK